MVGRVSKAQNAGLFLNHVCIHVGEKKKKKEGRGVEVCVCLDCGSRKLQLVRQWCGAHIIRLPSSCLFVFNIFILVVYFYVLGKLTQLS